MGSLPKGWRKAYGAIKDSTTVSLAKVNSEYKVLPVVHFLVYVVFFVLRIQCFLKVNAGWNVTNSLFVWFCLGMRNICWAGLARGLQFEELHFCFSWIRLRHSSIVTCTKNSNDIACSIWCLFLWQGYRFSSISFFVIFQFTNHIPSLLLAHDYCALLSACLYWSIYFVMKNKVWNSRIRYFCLDWLKSTSIEWLGH